jgi:hypothetical protein
MWSNGPTRGSVSVNAGGSIFERVNARRLRGWGCPSFSETGGTMTLSELLRAYGEAAAEAERPEVSTNAAGQKFTRIEDMSPQAAALAAAQNFGPQSNAGRPSIWNTKPNQDSCPNPRRQVK